MLQVCAGCSFCVDMCYQFVFFLLLQLFLGELVRFFWLQPLLQRFQARLEASSGVDDASSRKTDASSRKTDASSSMEHAASAPEPRPRSCPPRVECSDVPAAAGVQCAAAASKNASVCPHCHSRPRAQRRVAGRAGPEEGCCYLCVQRRGAPGLHTKTCSARVQAKLEADARGLGGNPSTTPTPTS